MIVDKGFHLNVGVLWNIFICICIMGTIVLIIIYFTN